MEGGDLVAVHIDLAAAEVAVVVGPARWLGGEPPGDLVLEKRKHTPPTQAEELLYDSRGKTLVKEE